jgi:hypothetical protein
MLADNFFLVGMFTTNAQKYDTHKPWAYWWWMGSAVDEAGIRKNLQDYAQAGLAAAYHPDLWSKRQRCQQHRFFESKMESNVGFHGKEAKNLGLGIDMTMGTGWPFGGKQVSEKMPLKPLRLFRKMEKIASKYYLPSKKLSVSARR